MKKGLLLIVVFLIMLVLGCSKGKENELEKNNIEAVLLKNISIGEDEFLYAICKNKEQKEVLVRYVNDEDEKMLILAVMDYNIMFSYLSFLELIEELHYETSKNAYNTIINKAEKIELTQDLKISEVLKIKQGTKFLGIVFFYRVEEKLNKFAIIYDLGDYYIVNETTKEIYYPIFCKYEDLI